MSHLTSNSMKRLSPRPALLRPMIGLLLSCAVLVAPGATGAVVLDDQTDATCQSTGGLSSQFFLNNPATSSQAADDFTVPPGAEWRVSAVEARGGYILGPGPAPSANIFIYADAAGLPGMLVHSSPAVVPSMGQASGDFTLDLVVPPILQPGTYWLSVQANLDFTIGGQWMWDRRANGPDGPMVFQRPTDPDCATFAPVAPPCFDDPADGSGLCFDILGVDLNAERPVPLMSHWTTLTLVVLLGGIAGRQLRRRT